MKEEFTYIVQWTETPQYCKIGKSTNPHTRLQAFLTVFPGTLRVLMICSSKLLSEKSLHDEFESLRYSGEHFSYNPDIQARILQLNATTGFKEYEIDRKIDPFSLLKLKENRPKYIRKCSRGTLQYRRTFPSKHKRDKKYFVRILCKPGEILDRVEFERRYFKFHAEYEAIENPDKKEFKAHEIWATHAYSIKYLRQIKEGSIIYRRSVPPNLRDTFGKQELSKLICSSTEVITVDEFFKRYDQAHQQIQSQIEEKRANGGVVNRNNPPASSRTRPRTKCGGPTLSKSDSCLPEPPSKSVGAQSFSSKTRQELFKFQSNNDMGSSRPPHLRRNERNGTWDYRRAIPLELRAAMGGKQSIVRALSTGGAFESRGFRRAYSAAVQEAEELLAAARLSLKTPLP